MRTIVFWATVLVCTIWHGMTCIIAGLCGVPWTRSGVYDRAQRRWSRTSRRVTGIPVSIEGAEHLNADGPQVLVSNHTGFFDILALLAALPVDAKFIVKQELYRIPVLGAAMRAAGHVRMDRGNQKQAFGAYEEAAAQMKEKKLTIVVYPEGTRTRTGDMLPFKKGPFVFAIGSGAPLIPCYVAGAFGIQPKGSIRVRKKPITIVLGPPIPTAGLRPEDRDALSDRTREAMLALKARVDTQSAGRIAR